MLSRRNLAVSFVAVMLLAMLAGCAAGDVQVPDRAVEISMDEALAAQDAAMAGVLMGSAEWTESQFSSLVTELIKQNAAGVPIESVKAWFTSEGLVLSVALTDGSAVVLSGNVMVEDNRIKVDLTGASALGMSVASPLLDVVEGAINRALDDPSLGVAVGVNMGEGTLSVAIGQ